MANAHDIIKRPVITERSVNQMAEKKYTFEVDVKASKPQIKDAVEAIFGVKVEKINTLISKPKAKRVGRHAGYTARRKKAVVTLTADSKELDYLG
ncbi:50S ribosomal protein L23 [Exiguobacterium sp. Helios]|uniref:Large ribosomal subunit protein uL23 n=1 Tax=Exiguobacterium antarcticum TaxID=132920 RepID=A0ABT6R445_9BACL|nr:MULTISPECIES: 50S ribosomal protein L23 [Exiguobacterium]AFS69264.1 50S ribosomal protein L23 [Exiguobacterium antarcticum B7]MCK2158984.1 50S ribosomal protein L23 [Exiguobacterium sp. 17-1]MCT4780504.1 50S ribosomal protein L23 [Exiguobacterium soli]MDI3235715.1 50S ribosomal protein L23 [Exiguobacterium antarcticum]QNR19767.1 50S ribosomal protein L23 [Exiguobacterium sp. Helios]